MALSPKELKKLAKACREAGIRVYKGEGFEIELTDEAPAPKRVHTQKKSVASQTLDTGEMQVESDMPDPSALLFWSSGGMPYEEENETKQ